MTPLPQPWVVAHPTGNRNTRAVLTCLQKQGLLHHFFTTLACPWEHGPGSRRAYPDIPWRTLRLSPWRELARHGLRRWPQLSLHQHETGWASVDQIYRALDRKTAKYLRRHPGTPAYLYEDGALHCIEAAQESGCRIVYELPIAYGPFAQQLLREEAERLPAWSHTLQSIRDSADKMDRKRREATGADIIVCPSRFVAESLPQSVRDSKKIIIARYGVDSPLPSTTPPPRQPGPLRVGFVGALSQRKGLADLCAAINLLKSTHIELHCLGALLAPASFYQQTCPGIHLHGPRPRQAVLQFMAAMDVLVLPSLIEGRALVQLEAASLGLPLIITPNTGGEDLILEGQTGYTVPIRSPEAIADKLDYLATHTDTLPSMRDAILHHVRDITWDKFEQAINQAIHA